MIAETSTKILSDHFITPNASFFIRGHSAIPERVDTETFKFKLLDNHNAKLAKYSLDDLKSKFKPHEVMVTLVCSGNRRKQMKQAFPEVNGNEWYVGAIGNAVFKGILIRDFLKAHGFDVEELRKSDKHIVVYGMDTDVTGKNFEVSIPVSLALDPSNEVMLAY